MNVSVETRRTAMSKYEEKVARIIALINSIENEAIRLGLQTEILEVMDMVSTDLVTMKLEHMLGVEFALN